MAKCPTCNSAIKDDFGLVTCTSCGAQVLLEFDGSTSIQKAAPDFDDDLTAPPVPVKSSGTKSSITKSSKINIPPLPINDESADVEDEEPQFLSKTPPPITSPDMGDVASFGNSDAGRTQDGILRFHLYIRGIDTLDIRKLVFEALDDDKFLWDPTSLLQQIRNGQLKISGLSAVKSALVIQRLRPLPVELSWEQYAIHSS